MVNGRQLLADLQPLRRRLEEDLRERSEIVPELGARLKDEWSRARQRERTAQAYEAWREDYLAQAAVMWILGCVFVRFLEDNGLAGSPRLAGPGERLRLARDVHTLYFQQHPLQSDRDYLYAAFEAVAALPGAGPLFDRRHNPVWAAPISGDAASMLLEFWARIDPATGALVHDFTDDEWRTRFLGDLYQDLSESARKKYALLQTPDFVLQFILDRTLTPAIGEFGFREVRLIDPACGSGHFLLESFDRLFRLWSQHEPGRNARELAQRALDQVSGVDLNPFAAAIARFRLLLAALRASGITRLADAPAFSIEVAAGDSLLHGPRPGAQGARQMYLDSDSDPLAHAYDTEDAADLRRLLGRRYHVVVGNPPYITPKDAALNKAYRERFGSCHMKYSLAVPFMERLFDLAIAPGGGEVQPAGYVGMITANSFMKREFGKKVIEEFIPRWDLTHVIDTSGAYIPGHGTPTVILLGRHREHTTDTIRAVLGIRGEPTTPDDPALGKVWTAILEQVDRPGSTGEFVSATDASREAFHRHPWSIGGGGAAELKERIDESAVTRLSDLADSIGITAFTLEDDIFLLPGGAADRHRIPATYRRTMVEGETIRDWQLGECAVAVFPYDEHFEPIEPDSSHPALRYLWAARSALANNKMFGGKTKVDAGLRWFEFGRLTADKLKTPLSITFAFVATHNHFVLDRGGKVFNRSAPVIKLPPTATEDDHLALLGLLNSSTACFWMKQVFYPKATISGDISTEKGRPEANRYEFAAQGLLSFPIPERKPLLLAAVRRTAAELHQLGEELQELDGAALVRYWISGGADIPLRELWEEKRREYHSVRQRMVGLQEELDWQVYGIFNLCPQDAALPFMKTFVTPAIEPKQRPFNGTSSNILETAGGTYELRQRAILESPDLKLIETSEFKRPWLGRQGVYGRLTSTYDERVHSALAKRLLKRMESAGWTSDTQLISGAALADSLRRDSQFMRAAAEYRGEETFNLTLLVCELVEDEAVPFLPILRYKPSGLRKREAWERTWDLQRREDAIDARTTLPDGDPERMSEEEAKRLKAAEVGAIPVPPKYTSADFASSTYWRLRGKLDVPKERFISYPHCERDADPTPVVAWAGWDHLQQARALATYYVQMKESEGWIAGRLTPLLAGLLELLPWLKQWHNDIDPEYGVGMGDYFEGFVDEEARALGLTHDAIRAWTPPARAPRRRRPGAIARDQS